MSELDESSLELSAGWNDMNDNHSIAGRARIRAQLEADIQAFLSQGGRIEQVDTLFRTDTPRKVELGLSSRSM
jgi:predicted XRE-type DNA-binding protein